jgi:hypothetical protein
MAKSILFRGWISIFMLVSIHSPFLKASVSEIDLHSLCMDPISRLEKEKGIPARLLSAIAYIESGRLIKERKKVVIWPWTINVQGKGYYFLSKEQAVQAVKDYKNQGITNIDVGCMQINLHHHKEAFETIEKAFDPKTNVEYAVNFLKQLKETHTTWIKAVAHYHSATPSFHLPYSQKVYEVWSRLGGKDENVTFPYSYFDTLRVRTLSPFRHKTYTFNGNQPQHIKIAYPVNATNSSKTPPPEVKVTISTVSPSQQAQGKSQSIQISYGTTPQKKHKTRVFKLATVGKGTKVIQLTY